MFRKNCFAVLFIIVVALCNFGSALRADETGVSSPLAPEAVSAALIKYSQQTDGVKKICNTVTDCGKFFVVEILTEPYFVPHIPGKPAFTLPGKTLANYRVVVKGIGNTEIYEASIEEMLLALRLNHRKFLILMASMNPSVEIGKLARQYEEKYGDQLYRITMDLEKALDADDQAGGDRVDGALRFIEESLKSRTFTPVYGELVDNLIRKLEGDLENAKMEHKNPVQIIKIKENLDSVKGCKARISNLSQDSEWKAFWNSAFMPLGRMPFPVEEPRGSFARNDLYSFVSDNRSEFADVLVYESDYEQMGQGKIKITMLARKAFINDVDDGRKVIAKAVYVMLKNMLYKSFTIRSRTFYSGTGEVLRSESFGKGPIPQIEIVPATPAKEGKTNPSGCFTPEDVQARAVANNDFIEFLKINADEFAPVPVEKILCQKVGKYDFQVTLLMGRIINIRDDGKKHIAKANYLLKSTFEPPCGTRFLKVMEREFYGLDGKKMHAHVSKM